MNRLTLIGLVGRPPTYHCTTSGQDLTRFELRTGTEESEEVHYCLSWGPAALDLHLNLREGDRLMIQGELNYRWKKLSSGKKYRMAEIKVKGYTYLGYGFIVGS